MTWQEEKKNFLHPFHLPLSSYYLFVVIDRISIRKIRRNTNLSLSSTAENIQFTFNTEFMLFSSVSHLSNFDSRLLLPSRKKSTQKNPAKKKS